MRRQPVESSFLTSVGYDADTAVLEIEFASGDVYQYFAVPPSVHRDLMDAPSPGAYFNRRINDRFPTRQRYD